MIKKVMLIIPIILLFFISGVSAREQMSHTDEMTYSARNVNKVRFRGIDFAELTYTGAENKQNFDVVITYTARVNDEEELEELIEEFDFDISKSDDIVTMRLRNLEGRDDGFLKNLFKQNERRIIMDVRGPIDVDIEINSDFSDILTKDTAGDIVFNSEFSTVNSLDHNGRLNANIGFGSLTAEELIGSFSLSLNFSEADIEVRYLDGDSRASVDFGSIDINCPADTGAEFRISKSLGDVNFDISQPLVFSDNNQQRMILNDGDHIVNLSAEFGKINIRDTMKSSGARSVRSRNVDSEKQDEMKPEPEPVFEEGIVRSIRIRGTRLYDRQEIEKKLDISTGKSYSREEIAEEVDKLSENRLIRSANFSINLDGDLSVRIQEIELYHNDFDIQGSFSRVGGVGIGPKLKVTSAIGPLSEFGGGVKYHFANKEWTYLAYAEKHLFDDFRFTFGGTYRLDYESSMDWTIPQDDSSINAFLLGTETKNYYQVEGSTGYISQMFTDMFEVKAEYFEEDFSSLKKHTNWSIFNHRHVKEDNPALNGSSLGKITGLRYSMTFNNNASFMNSEIHLEMEKTFDENSGTLPPYTRFLGSIVYNTRFAFNNLIKMRIAGGYSEDILPEQKSFRLGGVNTLRGYEFGMVPAPAAGMNGFNYQGGGSKMFLANFDYFTGHSGDNLRLILFGDVGNVWQVGEKVEKNDLKRDLGIGIAFEGDFFRPRRRNSAGLFGGTDFNDAFRVNWAVPVGNVSHDSMWTVNFVRAY
ncbi:BamA/TamA family outer membrane protein [Candidatus Latescibacterota bacterium]